MNSEKLTVNQSSRIIQKYIDAVGIKIILVTCASCGERTYDKTHKELIIEESLDILKLSIHTFRTKNSENEK